MIIRIAMSSPETLCSRSKDHVYLKTEEKNLCIKETNVQARVLIIWQQMTLNDILESRGGVGKLEPMGTFIPLPISANTT